MIPIDRMQLILVATLLAAACGDAGDSDDSDDTTGAPTSSSGSDSGGAPPEGSEAGSTTAAAPESSGSEGGTDATSGSSSEGGATTGDPSSGHAGAWIIEHFADAPVMTGPFDGRTAVETPTLVLDASGTNAKYAFDVREEEDPVLAEVGFVNVSVVDLVSDDAYGAGISTAYAPGAIAYLDNVYIEPNWPEWVGYDTTNYDGIVLDDSAEFYAEDLTVANWNADCALDIKTPIAQFVRLETTGAGNRTLRIWAAGPHYLVESSVNNPGGTVLWFADCATVTLNVYASTFNGDAEVAAEAIECDEGEAPNIVYLAVDPRTTGEMHPMFSDAG